MQPNTYNKDNLNPFSNTPSTFTSPTPTKGKNPQTIQDKLRDFVQKHRTLSIIIVIVFAILFFAGIILFIESKLPPKIEPEIAPSTSFDNRYLIEYSIGRSNSTQTFADLNSVILEPDAISSAPNLNAFNNNENTTFACTLVESSYKKLPTPEYTYSMDINVSDGRTYTLTVRLSPDYGSSYMVVIANRTDSDSATDYAFIHTNNTEEYTEELTNWINTFNLTSPNITVSEIIETTSEETN